MELNDIITKLTEAGVSPTHDFEFNGGEYEYCDESNDWCRLPNDWADAIYLAHLKSWLEGRLVRNDGDIIELKFRQLECAGPEWIAEIERVDGVGFYKTAPTELEALAMAVLKYMGGGDADAT